MFEFKKTTIYQTVVLSSSSSSLAVPPDWFSNPDSLKESVRIASSLDWANIDLSGHPGLCCLSLPYQCLRLFDPLARSRKVTEHCSVAEFNGFM